MAKHTEAEASAIILKALVDYQRIHQYPPTLREICDLTHFTLAALDYRLRQMERAGLIQREPRMARGIRVLERVS